jgi:hypothetical protein
MNHKASIYSNPVLPTGLYFCKLLDLHFDASDHPYIWSSLLTGPSYGEYSGTKLSSILYRTPSRNNCSQNSRPRSASQGLTTLNRISKPWGAGAAYQFRCMTTNRRNSRVRVVRSAECPDATHVRCARKAGASGGEGVAGPADGMMDPVLAKSPPEGCRGRCEPMVRTSRQRTSGLH